MSAFNLNVEPRIVISKTSPFKGAGGGSLMDGMYHVCLEGCWILKLRRVMGACLMVSQVEVLRGGIGYMNWYNCRLL
jgi:hypothetical protein